MILKFNIILFMKFSFSNAFVFFFLQFKSNEIEQLRIKSELEKFKPSNLIKLNKNCNGLSAAMSSNELIKQEQVSGLKKISMLKAHHSNACQP